MPTVRTLKAKGGKDIKAKVEGWREFTTGQDTTEWKRRYSQDALEYWAEEIKFYQDQKFDRMIMNTGEERSGKSTLAIRLAKMIQPDMPQENICFRIENLRKRIEEADEREVIIMDEAGSEFFSQQWWNKLQQELVKEFQVIGKKKLTIIMNLPHRSDLNKKIRERRVAYWADVTYKVRRGGIDRGFVEVTEKQRNKWRASPFWKPYLSFRFKQVRSDFWDEYEERKDQYIDEVSSGDRDVGTRSQKKYKKQRDRLFYKLNKEKDLLTQQEIADMVEDVDRSTVSKRITEYREEELGEDLT